MSCARNVLALVHCTFPSRAVALAFSTSNRTSFDRFVLEMIIGCCKGWCLEGKTETELKRTVKNNFNSCIWILFCGCLLLPFGLE